MPLYDFACSDCGRLSTLLMKYGDPALCPGCGGERMEKRLSPCAFTGFAAVPLARTPTLVTGGHSDNAAHVHGPACGCGPAPTACPADTKAGELIKKYLD